MFVRYGHDMRYRNVHNFSLHQNSLTEYKQKYWKEFYEHEQTMAVQFSMNSFTHKLIQFMVSFNGLCGWIQTLMRVTWTQKLQPIRVIINSIGDSKSKSSEIFDFQSKRYVENATDSPKNWELFFLKQISKFIYNKLSNIAGALFFLFVTADQCPFQ